MKYVLKASDINNGLSLKELRALAYEYAKKIGISYPYSWDENQEASSDWQLNFMKRHSNLSLRKPQQTSQKRATAFCKENVDAFFTNLSSVFSATPIEAHRIWNMDETGCPTVPSKPVKIVARKGQKRVGSSTSAERGTNVSVALAVSATGQSIPPFYIFPRKNWKESYMTHAGHGSVGVANKSGYMTSDEFPTFMRHFIKHTGANADVPTLLLLDNFVAHLTIEAIDLALHHGITMLSFPPHCTHRMQPLDVSVFSSFKTMFSAKHDAWKKSNIGVSFDLHHVPLIVYECLDAMLTPKIIKSGFRATGIFPFDAQIFSEVDFIASKLSSENLCDDDDDDDEAENADTQRQIIVSGDAHEEVLTSEPSTSGTASLNSHVSAKQLRDALKTVGPLKMGTPVKKSNRGRKPMKTAVLTSPEVVADLRDKAEKKRQRLAKKGDSPAAKKRKHIPSPTETDVEEDLDFCTVCKKNMPKKENRRNTAYCTVCDRGVHIRCAGPNPNTYTCVHCDSE